MSYHKGPMPHGLHLNISKAPTPHQTSVKYGAHAQNQHGHETRKTTIQHRAQHPPRIFLIHAPMKANAKTPHLHNIRKCLSNEHY